MTRAAAQLEAMVAAGSGVAPCRSIVSLSFNCFNTRCMPFNKFTNGSDQSRKKRRDSKVRLSSMREHDEQIGNTSASCVTTQPHSRPLAATPHCNDFRGETNRHCHRHLHALLLHWHTAAWPSMNMQHIWKHEARGVDQAVAATAGQRYCHAPPFI